MKIPVGICVPTIRPEQACEALEEWAPHWAAESGCEVRVYLHHDSPEPLVAPQLGLPCASTCHADLVRELGSDHWIVPRGSGACRSFPLWLAWRDGCEYVISLDDDCLPADDGHSFVSQHLAAFRTDRWFRTIHGDAPRGLPYRRLGTLQVALNHGLWTGIADLDGPTALVRLREPRGFAARRSEVVPAGMAFPMSAMNLCLHRRAMPAAYQLLMGLDRYGLDRFDDIWSGLLLKRVVDHQGWCVTSGAPVVRHERRSDPFANVRKEALGLQLHEYFWDYVLDAPLPSGLDVFGAYEALATHVARFPESFPALPLQSDYFPRLGEAMRAWAALLRRTQPSLV